MRPFVPAVGAATFALTGEAAGVGLGVPGPAALLLGLAGLGASVSAFLAAHPSAVAARRSDAIHRARRRNLAEARSALRLPRVCTDEDLARLRELRRQIRQRGRSEF